MVVLFVTANLNKQNDVLANSDSFNFEECVFTL